MTDNSEQLTTNNEPEVTPEPEVKAKVRAKAKSKAKAEDIQDVSSETVADKEKPKGKERTPRPPKAPKLPREKRVEAVEKVVKAVRPPGDSPFVAAVKRVKIPVGVKTVVVLTLITALSAALLAGTYNLTADSIREGRERALADALAAVMPECDFFELIDGAVFEEGTTAKALYAARSKGAVAGYAVTAAPNGYGGPIEMVVGVGKDGLVTGVSITDMRETPNLGTKAASASFLSRYVGKHAGVAVGRGPNDVDAIAGVTVTSRAVTLGVADALAAAAAQAAAEKEKEKQEGEVNHGQ